MTSYYDIEVGSDTIDTVVTNSPTAVKDWIAEVEYVHRFRLNRLVVGLDVEWRPSLTREYQNPAAILQLAVGRRCLVFQLLHARFFPAELRRFLSDVRYTFAGVEISEDIAKLQSHHGLIVSDAVDLRRLAVQEYGDLSLSKAGLKTLARRVLGVEMEKPKVVSYSDWDDDDLSFDQVSYAVSDAFCSFKIGRELQAWRYKAITRSNLEMVILGLGLGFRFLFFWSVLLILFGCWIIVFGCWIIVCLESL